MIGASLESLFAKEASGCLVRVQILHNPTRDSQSGYQYWDPLDLHLMGTQTCKYYDSVDLQTQKNQLSKPNWGILS